MIAAITGNLWRALALALCGLVAALWVQVHGLPIIGGGLKADLVSMTAANDANIKAHRQTKDNFRNAMADAQRREVFRLARVKAEQERINTDARISFDRRVAALRARYDGLRGESGAGVAGSPIGVAVPSVPGSPSGTDEATGADGFSLAERYEASIYATQLDELITWVAAQGAVRMNE